MADMEGKAKSRRNAFTAAFKLEACKLSKEIGNRAAARQLGLSEKNIRRWLSQKELVYQDMSKKANRGMKPKWPGLEQDLKRWILGENASRERITPAAVKLRARAIAEEKRIDDFKASKGWLVKFMRRIGLSDQCEPLTRHPLPENWLEKVKAFRASIAEKKFCGGVMQQNFVNVDEVPCVLEVPRGRTGGEANLEGSEIVKFTVVLAVSAAGEKLKPMVIFKGAAALESVPPNILVRANESGWIDARLMCDWMTNVWSSRQSALFSKPAKSECLLVYDACAAHLTTEVKAAVETHTELEVVPGGLTKYLQPLDISVNRYFKRHVRHLRDEWMRNGRMNSLFGGGIHGLVCDWIVEAWSHVSADCIKKGFVRAGVESYEDYVLQSDENGSAAEEVADKTDEWDDVDALVGDEFNGWEDMPSMKSCCAAESNANNLEGDDVASSELRIKQEPQTPPNSMEEMDSVVENDTLHTFGTAASETDELPQLSYFLSVQLKEEPALSSCVEEREPHKQSPESKFSSDHLPTKRRRTDLGASTSWPSSRQAPLPKTPKAPHLAPQNAARCAAPLPEREPAQPVNSAMDAGVILEEVRNRNITAVMKLLENGGQVNRSETCDDTPLAVATSNNDVNMVKLLLQQGADVQERGAEGITPLMRAATCGFRETAKILLEAGADVEACNGKEETALMLACAQDHKDVAVALIKSGSDIEQTDEDGFTPLMITASHGHICTTSLLLCHGVNVNAHSRTGHCPLSLAYEGGHLTLCELLLAHGASPQINKSKKSARVKSDVWEKHSELRKLLGKSRDLKEAESQTDWSIPADRDKNKVMIPIYLENTHELDAVQESLFLSDSQLLLEGQEDKIPEFRPWPRGTSLDSKTKHVVMNVLHHVMKSNSNLGMTDAGAITSEITGVSVRSMLRYSKQMKKNEGEELPEPSKRKTRKGKPRNARTHKYDDVTISVVRSKIHQFFMRNEIPSIDKVVSAVTADEQLPDLKRATIYRLICDLGFKYRKLSRKSILIDREDTVLWRRRYLRAIREYRKANRTIVYVDEAWCDVGHTRRHVWMPSTSSLHEALQLGLTTGMTVPTGKQQLVIITHAGNEHGFVQGTCDTYVSEYHVEMTAEYFEAWFSKKLLPSLRQGTVVVLDSASHHGGRAERPPDATWPLPDIQTWLTSRGLQWQEGMLKSELLEVVTRLGEIFDRGHVEALAAEASVEVLHLPPYHCLLNPLTLVWAWVKRTVALQNDTCQTEDVRALVTKAVAAVTPDMWASCVRHVIAEEERMLELDGTTEALVQQLRTRGNGTDSSAESGPEDHELFDGEVGQGSYNRHGRNALVMSRLEELMSS